MLSGKDKRAKFQGANGDGHPPAKAKRGALYQRVKDRPRDAVWYEMVDVWNRSTRTLPLHEGKSPGVRKLLQSSPTSRTEGAEQSTIGTVKLETQDGVPLGFKISNLLSPDEVAKLTRSIDRLCQGWMNSRAPGDPKSQPRPAAKETGTETDQTEADEDDDSDESEFEPEGSEESEDSAASDEYREGRSRANKQSRAGRAGGGADRPSGPGRSIPAPTCGRHYKYKEVSPLGHTGPPIRS